LLALITGNLISTRKYLDIAARDALLAMGAAALAMMPDRPRTKERAQMPARGCGWTDRDDPRSVH